MTNPKKLREMADNLQKHIDDKLAPRETNTPRRARMAASVRADGVNLQNAQRAMRALADAIDQNRLPIQLAGSWTKTKICEMMRYKMELGGGSYYVQTSEYSDTSPAASALQQLADAKGGGAELVAQGERDRKRSEVLRMKIPGFFPTPTPVADQMVREAGLDPKNPLVRILEPSAGRGDLADAIAKEIGPGGIDCCEVNHTLREMLSETYAVFSEGDFLNMEPMAIYDAVLMNPPFERRQDADHIAHAYRFLSPGGVLVALCSPMLLQGSEKKCQAFREWFEDLGGEILAESVDGFENTQARATMVRIAKPVEEEGKTWEEAKPGDLLISGDRLERKGIRIKREANELADRVSGKVWMDGPKRWAVVIPA